MSTEYYKFLVPFTSAHITRGERHDRLALWSRGGKCGELVVDAGDTHAILRMLICDTPSLITFWGGDTVGVVVEVRENLSRDACVVDDRGEIFPVSHVLAKHGSKKREARGE